MSVTSCAVPGCMFVFKTEELISSNLRYVCKNHPRSAQVEIVGRTYDISDSDDKILSFQDSQFDPILPRGVEYLTQDPDAPEGRFRRDVRRINTKAPRF